MPPTHIGRYRIISQLGAGGMGQVFLAEDPDLGRRVAVKVLTPGGHDAGEDRARRFMQEARLASAINHPNIAQIFEIGEADGAAYIVMELVEGEALSARVLRGPLDWPSVVDIGLQLFDALDEAHARGVVHRDLKPANVVVTARGHIKILDFGLAKRIGDEAARLNYSAPPELERIIRKALEKDAARRYQTARDVLVDLNNLKRDSDSDVQRREVLGRSAARPRRSTRSPCCRLPRPRPMSKSTTSPTGLPRASSTRYRSCRS